MPELPEVQTVVNQLAPHLTGGRISKLLVNDPLLGSPQKNRVAGRRIARVYREGKQIVIELSGAHTAATKNGRPLWLLIHLRMTGRLVWFDGIPPQRTKNPRTNGAQPPRFELILDGGRVQFFDTRRFGTLALCDDPAQFRAPGLDPLTAAFTQKKLAVLLRSTDQQMKVFLMRQDKITGLGNIYASEILHRAGISPQRRSAGLTGAEIAGLYQATKKILKKAVENCGTTFSDFQDAHGVTGSYQRLLQVYGRTGEPCGKCGAPIRRIVQQQRSTFYCENCQP